MVDAEKKIMNIINKALKLKEKPLINKANISAQGKTSADIRPNVTDGVNNKYLKKINTNYLSNTNAYES